MYARSADRRKRRGCRVKAADACSRKIRSRARSRCRCKASSNCGVDDSWRLAESAPETSAIVRRTSRATSRADERPGCHSVSPRSTHGFSGPDELHRDQEASRTGRCAGSVAAWRKRVGRVTVAT